MGWQRAATALDRFARSTRIAAATRSNELGMWFISVPQRRIAPRDTAPALYRSALFQLNTSER